MTIISPGPRGNFFANARLPGSCVVGVWFDHVHGPNTKSTRIVDTLLMVSSSVRGTLVVRPTVLGGDGLGHTTQRVHVASPETTNSFSLLLQDPGVSDHAAMAHRPWWQRVFDSVEPSPTPSPSPPPQLSRSAGIVLVSDEDSPVPLALRASDLPEWAPSPGDARWVDEFTRGGLGSLPRRQVSKMAGQGSRSGRRHAPRPRDHRGSQPRGAAPAVRSAPTSGSGAAGAALGLSAPAGACFGTPPAFASAST